MRPIDLIVKHRVHDRPTWPANVHYQRQYAAVAGGMVAVTAQLMPGELKHDHCRPLQNKSAGSMSGEP